VLCIVFEHRLVYNSDLYIEFSAQEIAKDVTLHFSKVFYHHYDGSPTHLTPLSRLCCTYASSNADILVGTQVYISSGPHSLAGRDYRPSRTAQSRSRIVDFHAFACAGKH
jgi:hypothetical protein